MCAFYLDALLVFSVIAYKRPAKMADNVFAHFSVCVTNNLINQEANFHIIT